MTPRIFSIIAIRAVALLFLLQGGTSIVGEIQMRTEIAHMNQLQREQELQGDSSSSLSSYGMSVTPSFLFAAGYTFAVAIVLVIFSNSISALMLKGISTTNENV